MIIHAFQREEAKDRARLEIQRRREQARRRYRSRDDTFTFIVKFLRGKCKCAPFLFLLSSPLRSGTRHFDVPPRLNKRDPAVFLFAFYASLAKKKRRDLVPINYFIARHASNVLIWGKVNFARFFVRPALMLSCKNTSHKQHLRKLHRAAKRI